MSELLAAQRAVENAMVGLEAALHQVAWFADPVNALLIAGVAVFLVLAVRTMAR